MADINPSDPSCALSYCSRVTAQVDCIKYILQGDTACVDIQFFGIDGNPLNLDNYDLIQVFLFNYLECPVASYYYPGVPTGECDGFLLEVLQETDTSGFISDEGLIRVCLNSAITSRFSGTLYAEIKLIQQTSSSTDITGIQCIGVVQINESKIQGATCPVITPSTPTGAPNIIGYIGATGATGATGFIGATGTQGYIGATGSGSAEAEAAAAAAQLTADSALDEALDAQAGYSHTGAFAGKPLTNNYVWEAGTGISYTAEDVAAGKYKVFSLDRDVHNAVDNPYWTIPTPTGATGIGLFQGANLPNSVSTLVDYDYNFDVNYPAATDTGFEGSTGRIRLNDLKYGDQLRVRFDFNIIPQIENTTVEPALWYSNRDDNDNITFTFPLTAQPIFFGTSTVAKTFLNRVEISAWITSNEDVNALTLPAIKSDNPVIVQPLGLLITILR